MWYPLKCSCKQLKLFSKTSKWPNSPNWKYFQMWLHQKCFIFSKIENLKTGRTKNQTADQDLARLIKGISHNQVNPCGNAWFLRIRLLFDPLESPGIDCTSITSSRGISRVLRSLTQSRTGSIVINHYRWILKNPKRVTVTERVFRKNPGHSGSTRNCPCPEMPTVKDEVNLV